MHFKVLWRAAAPFLILAIVLLLPYSEKSKVNAGLALVTVLVAAKYFAGRRQLKQKKHEHTH